MAFITRSFIWIIKAAIQPDYKRIVVHHAKSKPLEEAISLKAYDF
jgi:hypothetical protein